jgi:hypothetical protein
MGIYVGAAVGPGAYGLLSSSLGYPGAWGVAAGVSLLAAGGVAYAAST